MDQLKRNSLIEGIQRSINEYKIQRKKNLVESLGLYNKCQLSCYSMEENYDEKCNSRCQLYLDTFQDIYKEKPFKSFEFIFKYRGQDESTEIKKLVTAEELMKRHLEMQQEHLDGWNQKIDKNYFTNQFY